MSIGPAFARVLHRSRPRQGTTARKRAYIPKSGVVRSARGGSAVRRRSSIKGVPKSTSLRSLLIAVEREAMALSRREMLTFGALTGGAMLIPLERSVLAAPEPDRGERPAGPFSVPFALPPVANPVKYDDTTDYYAMTMREQATQIIPGYQTRIWGYNGMFPGPTIRGAEGPQGRRPTDQPAPGHAPDSGLRAYTSAHLHGSASLPQYDGYASDVTCPASTRTTCTRTPRAPGPSGTTTTASTTPRRTPTWVSPRSTSSTTRREASLASPGGLRRAAHHQDAVFGANGQLLYEDGGQSGALRATSSSSTASRGRS